MLHPCEKARTPRGVSHPALSQPTKVPVAFSALLFRPRGLLYSTKHCAKGDFLDKTGNFAVSGETSRQSQERGRLVAGKPREELEYSILQDGWSWDVRSKDGMNRDSTGNISCQQEKGPLRFNQPRLAFCG